MSSAASPRATPVYRPGDFIGTSRGQLVMGRNAAGHAVVRSRTSTYRVPAGLADRAAVRQWAQRQIDTGGIGTLLYARPGQFDPARVARARTEAARALGAPVVWQRDLISLSRTVGQLTGAERQALVTRLAGTPSPRGSMLERWIAESAAPGILGLGPLDARQRQGLFDQLVRDQDPASLHRIAHAAFGGAQRSSVNAVATMIDFARAVSRQGTFEQRLGLLVRLSDDAVRAAPGTAQASAELFAGMRNAKEVEAAFAALDRTATDAMVAGALPLHLQAVPPLGTQAGGIPTAVQVRGDSTLFRRLAAASSMSANAREKASFVAAAGAVLQQSRDQITIGGLPTRREILAALSAVIATDVNGVIENTLLQTGRGGSSSGRAALRGYTGALLDTGLSAEAGRIIVQLQRGPQANASPMAWLSVQSARNGEPPGYHRARVLGEFLGLAAAEVERRQRSRDLESATAYAMFAGGADSLKETAGTVIPSAKLPAALMAAGAKSSLAVALLSWRSQLRQDETDWVKGLHETALPRHPNGVEATAPWVTTFNAHYFGALRR